MLNQSKVNTTKKVSLLGFSLVLLIIMYLFMSIEVSATGNTLNVGGKLLAGGTLVSTNGSATFTFQRDGNAVVTIKRQDKDANDKVISFRKATGKAGGYIYLEANGALKAKKTSTDTAFQLGKVTGATKLVMDDDGVLRLKNNAGTTLYSYSMLYPPNCKITPVTLPTDTRVNSDTTTQKTTIITNNIFPTTDTIVADLDVTKYPYFADNTGTYDATRAIQQAINDCGAKGGGTVWMPAGKYNLTNTINLVSFVSLRGDWKDPDNTDPNYAGNYGTVVQAYLKQQNRSLFRLANSSGVVGITTYYPQQDAYGHYPYDYTFRIKGNTGNNSIMNCTLLNSYRGYGQVVDEGDTCVATGFGRARNIKGTCLYEGICGKHAADVMTWENITLKNDYWENAGSSFHAPKVGLLDNFTKKWGTGLFFADNDMIQFSDITVQDYNIGLYATISKRIKADGSYYTAGLEASFFNLNISNTNVGIYGTPLSQNNGITLNKSNISGSQYSIINDSNKYITAQRTMNPAYVRYTNTTLSGPTRGRLLPSTNNNSPTSSNVNTSSHKPPSGKLLYNVRDPNYNAPYVTQISESNQFDNVRPSVDATTAIQKALNDAGSAGGGVVYIPAGWYLVSTHLTVPANVELRGAYPYLQNYSSPLDGDGVVESGTMLFAQEGKNDANKPSLITLNGDNAGVRGLSFIYTGNRSDPNSLTAAPIPYPYTIKGNGANNYVIGSHFVACYAGIDFSNCPNHFILDIVGGFLVNPIRVSPGTGSLGWIQGVSQNHGNGDGWCYPMENTRPNSAYHAITSRWTLNYQDLIRFAGGGGTEYVTNSFSVANLHGVNVDSSASGTINIVNIGTDSSWSYSFLNNSSTAQVNVSALIKGCLGKTVQTRIAEMKSGNVNLNNGMTGGDPAIYFPN